VSKKEEEKKRQVFLFPWNWRIFSVICDGAINFES